LIKYVEERLATKLVDIERQRALVEVNVKRSEELLNHLRDVTEIEEERSPYVLLARAREAAMVVPPRSAEVSSLLSKLAVMQGVNGYDLNSAAMIANMVDEPGLAKVLFAKAIETGNAPYTAAAYLDTAAAYLAQLSARDPDSRRHKEVLQSMLTEHYASEEVIISTANFYIDTEDWDGLEDAMRKAGDAAPSSITPPRNRALAASRKGEAEEKVVRFYDMALEKPGGATSADTLGFYANYLFNNGFPRSNEDALKVKEIFEQLLLINPRGGRSNTKILEAAL
jgi:hypothetical protein